MKYLNWRSALIAACAMVAVALPAWAATYHKGGVIAPAGNHVKLTDSTHLRFGDGAAATDPRLYDVSLRWDGTDLDVLALANNTVWKWGDGTTSFDMWWYGSSTSLYLLWDASANDLIFQDSVSAMFGTGSDVEIRWDGTDLDILFAADDSVVKVGNGTNSGDVWLYGNTASDYILWDASAGKLSLEGSAYAQHDSFRRTISAKTGDYTVTAADSGTLFTTTGAAGAVEFTLPATGTTGLDYTFCNTVDQNMTVTAPADELVAFNNVNATSVSFQTVSEKVGGCFRIYSDANQYIAQVMLGAETQTPTVTD